MAQLAKAEDTSQEIVAALLDVAQKSRAEVEMELAAYELYNW
jgi:HPt (histidine-containing phosphotransfer) domain-containing protein